MHEAVWYKPYHKGRMEVPDGKKLLTVEDLAAKLNISTRTIYNQIAPKAKREFPIKPKRIGKLIRFDEQEVDEYIERL